MSRAGLRGCMLYISVVGASSCNEEIALLAYELGRVIAKRGHTLVCGGLSGVMEAVSHGATEEGGITVGILPDIDRRRANRWLTVSIPTDIGHARNTLVALSGDALIAVSGGYGTLSEISFGLKHCVCKGCPFSSGMALSSAASSSRVRS